MTKVVALSPIVGSYPVAKGETPDFLQRETRTVGEMGEVVNVQVGYRAVRVTLALERAATPGDLQDDAARVAQGDTTRIHRAGNVPILMVPGTVSSGGVTIEGDPGENPVFDLPDATAKEWAERGLVKIVETTADQVASPTAPPADPRTVAKRSLARPAESAA